MEGLNQALRGGLRLFSSERVSKLEAGDLRLCGAAQGGRGTYTLIRETWKWVYEELGLEDEATKIAEAYVKPDGTYAYV